MKTTHTDAFNQIVAGLKKPRQKKQPPMQFETIEPRANMNPLQHALSMCTLSGNVVHLPAARIDNYQELRAALLRAGASYKRNTFVFPHDARPYVDRLMGGETVNLKKEFQFFATPQELADEMAAFLKCESHHRVLEPSAGQGALIAAVTRRWQLKNLVDFCELMPENIQIIAKDVHLRTVSQWLMFDFLNMDSAPTYDRIIANPPFSKNQDIAHIHKMYEMLAPGGRIVTVASNSWTFGTQKKQVEFRKWLLQVEAVVEELERGTFTESGTEVPAQLLIIDKPKAPEKKKSNIQLTIF